jgi:Xaa-Pro aminopeptidase
VFITKKGEKVVLLLDSDLEVYKAESVISDIRPFRDHDPLSLFKKVIAELDLSHAKLGLELGRPGLPHHTLRMLRHAIPHTVEFENGEYLIEEIRAIKSAEEIEEIKKAAGITELGLETAIKNIRPGVKESDVVLEAEYAMRKAGGRIPVLNYVASGKRSCLAHHTASAKVIEAGDVVALDIHGGFKGYCADLARTVVCGKASAEVKRAYACMIRAEEETIAACRPGARMTDVKKIFYHELNQAQGLHFLMGPVLHGVGIMNSEMPYFQFPYQAKGYPEVLAADMVVAVSNIGLYSQKGWGVRVEDTVWLTDKGPVYLTNFSKDLISI